MKPFLGIDLTTDKENERFNGDEFLVVKPSPALTQSLERSSENVDETIEKGKLPLPLRIGRWICCVLGISITMVTIKTLLNEEITFGEAYRVMPGLFWLGGACLLVWGLLEFLGTRKMNAVLETDESDKTFNNLNSVCDAIYAELRVPPDSKEVDLLSFFYKEKDGTIKVCEKIFQTAPYLNLIFDVFADTKNLYLANLEGKYAIPLSSIKTIRTVKKSIRITDWNKEEPYNKGIYKPYKISVDDNGCVHCKYYHIIEFDREGETWGMYIPCYELPVFEKLTGLTASEPV